jgi:hypothetical protein
MYDGATVTACYGRVVFLPRQGAGDYGDWDMPQIKNKKMLLSCIGAAVLLAVLLFVLLYGRGGSAYRIYERETERFYRAPSVEAAVRADLSMAREDRQMSTGLTGTVRRNGADGAADMEAELTLDYFGESYEQKLYYTGGVLYRDFMGRKLKSAADFSEAAADFRIGPFDFPEEAVATASVADNDSGGGDVVLMLDVGATRDFLMEHILTMDGMSGFENADFDFLEAKVRMGLGKNGRLKSRLLMITASVVLNGTEATLIYELELNVMKTGGVEVSPPPDPESYLDAPEGEID